MKKFIFLVLITTVLFANNQTSPSHPYSYGYSCEGNVVVNTYTLPPCPDKKLNDSTLLGIDTNNNGVRDDVERWLITRYKDHHAIATEIGFQLNRADQFMLANPDEWQEADKKISAAQNCNSYFRNYASDYNEPILIDHSIATYNKLYNMIQFNTNQRIRAYLQFDQKLSGGVYVSPKIGTLKSYCDFDIDTLLTNNTKTDYVTW
ncbi:MAG: hypothetical protein ACK5LP_09040 [Campylobacteraceae bacterium]